MDIPSWGADDDDERGGSRGGRYLDPGPERRAGAAGDPRIPPSSGPGISGRPPTRPSGGPQELLRALTAPATSSASFHTWNASRTPPARPAARVPAAVSRERSEPASSSGRATTALPAGSRPRPSRKASARPTAYRRTCSRSATANASRTGAAPTQDSHAG